MIAQATCIAIRYSGSHSVPPPDAGTPSAIAAACLFLSSRVTTTFSNMQSVLMVSFNPPVTSSPLCTSIRCWNTSTLPIFGSTSKNCFLFGVQNLVAPPSSPSPSFRYKCIVTKLFRCGKVSLSSYKPSQCGLKYCPGPYRRNRRRWFNLVL
jgi:hypothetical protein